MAGARVRIEGGEELRKRLETMQRQGAGVVEKALLRAGQLLRTEAVKTVYERFATKQEAKAGKVFATPHVHLWGKSGALKASLTVQPAGASRVEVGSALVYAPVHEFGADIQIGAQSRLATMVGTKIGKGKNSFMRISTRQRYSMGGHMIHIPKRPYMGPALAKTRPAIERTITEAVEKLLKGVVT